MYAISAKSVKSDYSPKETKKVNQLNSLLNLVNTIYGQLKFIKAQSLNGAILDEIIERTEVFAFNIKHNHPVVLNSGYIDDYQKDFWQLLSELYDAEERDGMATSREEQKGVFFELFRNMDRLVNKIRQRNGRTTLISIN